MPWPPGHAANVRLLYKSIFRLHRGLPHELRAIGDAYAREEFKRHLTASEEHTRAFMQEWSVSSKLRLSLSNDPIVEIRYDFVDAVALAAVAARLLGHAGRQLER